MHLYQVKPESFVAGVAVNADGRIVYSAPVLGRFVGQHGNNLLRWVRIKGGDLSYLGCLQGERPR